MAPIAGRLVDRIGERPLVVTGLALQAVGTFWISQITNGSVQYSEAVEELV